MNNLISQNIINKLSSYSSERRRHDECLYDRIVHNDLIHDLLEELSDDTE